MHRRLLIAIWLSAFLVSLDYTAVTVALPTMASDFDVGTSDVSWIALSYMLVMVALLLPSGPIIDRVGYTRALTGGLALFAGASLASAFCSTLWMLVAMRAVQGVGAATMFAIGPAVIKTAFPREAQSRAFAIFSTGPTAGLCAGPAIGGQLTQHFGWQAIFLFSLVAALLSIVMLRSGDGSPGKRRLKGPDPATRVPHVAVIAAAFGGLLALMLALNRGQEWGWSSPSTLALLGGASALFTFLVAHERRCAAPLVDRALLVASGFTTTVVVLFPLLMVFGGSVFLVPFWLEWFKKADSELVGGLLMIQPAATIAVSALSGMLLAGIGRRSLCLMGIVLFMVGVATLAVAEHDDGLALPAAALALMGSGMGLFYPALLELGMAGVPHRLAASASGLQGTGRTLAQLLGVILFESLFAGLFPLAANADLAAAAQGADLLAMRSAFTAVFWCGAAIAAIALLPAAFLTNALRKQEVP